MKTFSTSPSAHQAFKRFALLTTPIQNDPWFKAQNWNGESFLEEYKKDEPSILPPFTDPKKTGALLALVMQGRAVSFNTLKESGLLAKETWGMMVIHIKEAKAPTFALDEDIRNLNAKKLKETFGITTPFLLLAACIICNELEKRGIPFASTSPQAPRAASFAKPREAAPA